MEEIQNILNNIIKRIEVLEHSVNILLNPKTKSFTPYDNDEKTQRDKTKYMFNGKIYSKNKLVLAVVNEYVLQNPSVNYDKLSQVFDKSLQGSLGVVRLYNDILNRQDADKRFFTNNAIMLTSGEKVVVCTQWGLFNITRFILRANNLNFTITEI